ncbi:MAG: DNA mismatch repair protein MutS, partial [Bdellovibrionales bacterium]|nr:DNA mismatch repair protein MutS [Oligoflexia bacterium]
SALSLLGQSNGWCFPVIDESYHFKLTASRHPVVDHALKGEFVANDIELSPETARTLVITGPNMGGKSTLMRQMAQIILLGQMGAPVPAKHASWGVFHSLYTRIGAQDAIAKGQSTFMVEMVELAHILNHADSRSFIVLDEIGRGTSTFDGMSVAHASLEHLHNQSNARIVFATHYHELTELEAKLPYLKNAFMKVLDDKGKLTFLYELALGRSSKSFGIQVAELAGLPKPVIKKAWEILKKLEAQNTAGPGSSDQLSLFMSQPDDLRSEEVPDPAYAAPETEWIKRSLALKTELEALDVDAMRPIDALQYVANLRDQMLAE